MNIIKRLPFDALVGVFAASGHFRQSAGKLIGRIRPDDPRRKIVRDCRQLWLTPVINRNGRDTLYRYTIPVIEDKTLLIKCYVSKSICWPSYTMFSYDFADIINRNNAYCETHVADRTSLYVTYKNIFSIDNQSDLKDVWTPFYINGPDRIEYGQFGLKKAHK